MVKHTHTEHLWQNSCTSCVYFHTAFSKLCLKLLGGFERTCADKLWGIEHSSRSSPPIRQRFFQLYFAPCGCMNKISMFSGRQDFFKWFSAMSRWSTLPTIFIVFTAVRAPFLSSAHCEIYYILSYFMRFNVYFHPVFDFLLLFFISHDYYNQPNQLGFSSAGGIIRAQK